VYDRLRSILTSQLTVVRPVEEFPQKPWVVLVVGVNGVGKTTTIGKLANEYRTGGKKVMLAAADTFRAGAVEQLKIWAERTGSEFVAQQAGSDPASVAFDALEAAKARGIDVLLVDTAGRLHSKGNLMQELEKVARVIRRNTPHAPNEVVLVVDGSTGQNAIRQAQAFNQALGLTGVVVTKLDGTAKGGAVLAITRALQVPIVRVGVGEAIEDLQRFDPAAYAEAMVGSPQS
jgi:fused signal recognition particle receptor